jgi:hypothetical protein
MPVLKHVAPTATYSRILKKIGLDLNEAAKMSMAEIKPKVYGLKDEDMDAQFEFIEQQQQFCEQQGEDATFTTEPVAEFQTDRAPSSTVSFDSGYCGRSSGISEPTALDSQGRNLLFPNFSAEKRRSVAAFPIQFQKTLSKLSQGTISTLQRENLVSEQVFARISDRELEELEIPEGDITALKCMVVQARLHAARKYKLEKQPLMMPENVITKALPISSKVTLKALKKHKMLNLNLYTTCPVEEITAIFARYPAIPKEDRQNILGGVALARYAQKLAPTRA